MIEKLGQLDQQNIMADQQTLLGNQHSLIEKLGQLQSHVEILIAQRERTGPEQESDSSESEDGGGSDGDGGATKESSADKDGGPSKDGGAGGDLPQSLGKRKRMRPAAIQDFVVSEKKRKKKPERGYRRLELAGRPDKDDIR